MDNQVRRLGVLLPPGNVAIEREFPLLLPPGVVINHNRLSRERAGVTDRDSLLGMADSLERAASDLAQAHPEFVLYGCTSGSFMGGPGHEADIARRIQEITGIRAITTSTAVVGALRAMRARRVYMVTPYPDEINAHEVCFLAHYGIEVAGWDSFRCGSSEKNRGVASEQVAAMVLQHGAEAMGCDAIFISCTNLLSADQIPILEHALDRPVVSSNQASLWAALRNIEVDTRGVAAGGRLFSCLDVPDGKLAAA